MLGLFKRMLSKQETLPPASPAASAKPATLSPAARAAVAAKKAAAPSRGPVAPAAVVSQQKPAATPAQAPAPVAPPATSTHVHIALVTIASSLPEALSHKVPANPEHFVPIPVDKVLPQLAQGQIIMTVGELRECAPESFSALAGHDEIPVTLPLGDVVRQLSPEQFGRRNQRRLDVPSELSPVFAPGTGAVSGTKAPVVHSAPVTRPQPTVTSTTPAPVPSGAHAPAGQVPASKIAMSPHALAALGGSNGSPTTSARPAVTTTPKPLTTTPSTSSALPAATFSRTPVSVPKKPAAPAKITGELTVPLAAFAADLIEEVRRELTDVDVTQYQVLVPLEALSPMMKSGRILFSWQELVGWMQPPFEITPTPKVGELPVELPLKVIAPLFMAHHRGTTQKRVAVDETIPDLFSGGDSSGSVQAQIAPVVAPSKPEQATAPTMRSAPAPVAVAPAAPVVASAPTVATPVRPKAEPAQPVLKMVSPVAAPAPAPVAPAAPVVENQISVEKVIGAPGARLGAKEIVANSARLPGVEGALLVMSDGLLVTGNLPSQFKAETISAFLPQMFGRMTQYTRELSLGSLDRITLSVESGEWHVLKLPNIYFAVLGKRGETLSFNLLAQIAAELSSQSK